jgi:hypothetical protein
MTQYNGQAGMQSQNKQPHPKQTTPPVLIKQKKIEEKRTPQKLALTPHPGEQKTTQRFNTGI